MNVTLIWNLSVTQQSNPKPQTSVIYLLLSNLSLVYPCHMLTRKFCASKISTDITGVSNGDITAEPHNTFTEPTSISCVSSIPGYLLKISASIFTLPAPQYFYTDRSKAVLLLWFLTVLAVCVYTLVHLLC